jgi:hypothetical protein
VTENIFSRGIKGICRDLLAGFVVGLLARGSGNDPLDRDRAPRHQRLWLLRFLLDRP